MITQPQLSKLGSVEDKLIAIDLDGTLADGNWYKEWPRVNQEILDLVWKWYIGRAHIIIYTSRQPRYFAITHAWLIANEVPFHGIAMTMKPSADIYVDDRSLVIDT